jgi:hypothetical protein
VSLRENRTKPKENYRTGAACKPVPRLFTGKVLEVVQNMLHRTRRIAPNFDGIKQQRGLNFEVKSSADKEAHHPIAPLSLAIAARFSFNT